MGNRAQRITDKGRRILLIGAAGPGEAEVVAALGEIAREIHREDDSVYSLALLDTSGIEMTTDVVNEAKGAIVVTGGRGNGLGAKASLNRFQNEVAQLSGSDLDFGSVVENCQGVVGQRGWQAPQERFQVVVICGVPIAGCWLDRRLGGHIQSVPLAEGGESKWRNTRSS